MLLDPAVSVGHHGYQEVDQDDDGEGQVGGEHQLEQVDSPAWRITRRYYLGCLALLTHNVFGVHHILVAGYSKQGEEMDFKHV